MARDIGAEQPPYFNIDPDASLAELEGAVGTAEQYRVFADYQARRHTGGEMSNMTTRLTMARGMSAWSRSSASVMPATYASGIYVSCVATTAASSHGVHGM